MDSGTVLPDIENDEERRMTTFVRWLRLGTGLILATFLILHLLNLALGLLSIEAMERFRKAVTEIWYHPLGGPLLYSSFLIHFLLALWSLYRRSNLRLKPWEAMQLTLGLLILPLAASHMIGIRLSAELYHVEVTYPQVVARYWLHPWTGWKQVILLAVIWLHMAIGLHYWLRLKPWYPKAVPVLYLAAALLPVLALLGLARTGLTISPDLASPEWVARLFAPFKPEHEAVLHAVEYWALVVMGGMLLATLAAREVRRLIRNRYGSFRLSLETGRQLVAPVGVTMLEAIRAAGIPHASVCGGRGRCTTCRVRINMGLEALPMPNDTEQRALARIEAPRNVRLACQTRPRRDLSIMPLLPPGASAQAARRLGAVQGHEQTVTVMFLDLRGSTALGERLLPYDTVFLLNRFFAEMSAALRETGGHYAQFNGDGLMALYGLERGVERGCRDALIGAAAMFRRLAMLNESLAAEMGQELRMGIGIHTGEAIVGTMGPPDAPTLTAVGDIVNVSARLESETKTFGCRLVVSETTAAASGLDFSPFNRHTAMLRGRSEPLPVYAIDDVDTLAMQPA
jgi:adenylate cyclase